MCERAAERKRYAPAAAQRAIETDFRQGLGAGFLRRSEAAISTALHNLPGMRALPEQYALGGSNTAIERQLYANASHMLAAAGNTNARDLMLAALSQTVAFHLNAQLRECTRHALANGINGRVAAEALRLAVSHINPIETARRIIEGAPAHRGPLRPSIELDEAL